MRLPTPETGDTLNGKLAAVGIIVLILLTAVPV